MKEIFSLTSAAMILGFTLLQGYQDAKSPLRGAGFCAEE